MVLEEPVVSLLLVLVLKTELQKVQVWELFRVLNVECALCIVRDLFG